jgi:hypothetical protein
MQILPLKGKLFNPDNEAALHVVLEVEEPRDSEEAKTPSSFPALNTAKARPVSIPEDSPAASLAASDSGARRKLAQATRAGVPVQDLLIVYTTAAKNMAGGKDAIEAQARNSVILANKAYRDSDINLIVNLVSPQICSKGLSTVAGLPSPWTLGHTHACTSARAVRYWCHWLRQCW